MSQSPPPVDPGPGTTPPESQPVAPPPGGRSAPAWGYPGSSTGTLQTYLERNRGAYTDEALTAQAKAAGHSDEAITAAFTAVRAAEAAAPVRNQAKRIVQWAYGLTFAGLTIGMVLSSPAAAGFGVAILIVSMLVGLGISLVAVRSAASGASIAVILALPIILLIGIAGACVATGLPVGRAVY